METDSITAPDVEEQGMRELGIQTDAAQGREDVAAAETPQPQAPDPQYPDPNLPPPPPERDGTEPESPEPEQIAAEQLGRDRATGQFKKAERPETDYSRAQKEQVRKDRSWQALQAEKEQIRFERAQWQEQQRMQQLEAARQQYQPVKREGLTAQQYFQGAQRFEQEGDHENALKAYKVASELGHADQSRFAEFQKMDQEYQWRTQLQQVSQVEPKVFDPSTPIGSHVQRIINGNPWLYNVPEGFLRAAEFAHMLTQIEHLKEKDDEIIALKAELEKSQRRGQPSKGGYASPRTGEKDFDEMNLDEQEAHLRHLTAEADSWK